MSQTQEQSIGPRVTEDSVDPPYDRPYVDVDEQRADPVPHRYVHGGFTGTDAQFSVYLPPAEQYEGRFFHNTYPLAESSDIGPFPIAFDVATGDLGFTVDSGAYYLQTNLGGADRATDPDPTNAAFRVNAAAAKYARTLAVDHYRETHGEHRPYGYLFGGSGGSYQVQGAAENTVGVWDGFLPFVLGTPNSIPGIMTVRLHALRELRRRDRWPAAFDAIDVGGSGDPFAVLDEEERAALREASRLGFPLRGWWNHAGMTSGYLGQVAWMVGAIDPAYETDFWSQPGYLGADPESSIHAARVVAETTVTAVDDGPEPTVTLAEVPGQDFADAKLYLLSGESAGKRLPLGPVAGATVGFSPTVDRAVLATVRPGDRVRIDNSLALALQTHQRHQVPGPDLYGWDQFRGPDGEPVYPQRATLIGPMAAAHTCGAPVTGRVTGKVLALQCLLDIDAFAWQADWYRTTVREALGDGFEDSFALWFIDRAQHDDPQTAAGRAHVTSFRGALQQGLRDLAAWVEGGERPRDTRYEVHDTQVVVPASAADRGGIQPVVELLADGGPRAEVACGRPVTLTATIEVPPGAGTVIAAEWDVQGRGEFADAEPLDGTRRSVTVTRTQVYDRPGTYFPVVRAASHRDGDTATPYARVQNLGRARVVVR